MNRHVRFMSFGNDEAFMEKTRSVILQTNAKYARSRRRKHYDIVRWSRRHLSTRLDASINTASASAADAAAAIIAQVVRLDLASDTRRNTRISSTEKRRTPMLINGMNARPVCLCKWTELIAGVTDTGS